MPPTIVASTALKLTLEELKTPQGTLKAKKAIAQGRKVVIKADGAEGFLLGSALSSHAVAPNNGNGSIAAAAPDTDDTVPASAVAETIVITVAIVVGVIAVIGLGFLAAICLDGMNKGFTVTAIRKTSSDLFEDETRVVLTPPVSTPS